MTRKPKEEKTNWHNYFYKNFPELMTSYYRKYIDVYNCSHHNKPKDLALIGEPLDLDLEKYNEDFFICWFGVSLIDQVLSQNNKEYHETWRRKFNDHPIPMKGGGMGCLEHAPPTWLLTKHASIATPLNQNKIKEFLIFLDKITRHEFVLLGLDYSLFVSALVNDNFVYADKSKEAKIVRSFYLKIFKNETIKN